MLSGESGTILTSVEPIGSCTGRPSYQMSKHYKTSQQTMKFLKTVFFYLAKHTLITTWEPGMDLELWDGTSHHPSRMGVPSGTRQVREGWSPHGAFPPLLPITSKPHAVRYSRFREHGSPPVQALSHFSPSEIVTSQHFMSP